MALPSNDLNLLLLVSTFIGIGRLDAYVSLADPGLVLPGFVIFIITVLFSLDLCDIFFSTFYYPRPAA